MEDLDVRPGLIEAPGLDSVPPYKTYWHFGSMRLKDEGLENVFSLAFMMEMGICPGRACPNAKDRCDPRCPALRAWLDEVVNG